MCGCRRCPQDGETGPGLGEPQRGCQHPGMRRGSAGETQGTSEEEGTHAQLVVGLGAACWDLGPGPASPATPPALGGADE